MQLRAQVIKSWLHNSFVPSVCSKELNNQLLERAKETFLWHLKKYKTEIINNGKVILFL